ncbi:MAG: hypothetical protein Tsb0010_04220 [Parvularculaceae bacterium]
MRCIRHKCKRSGFTLVEAMVALGVLATVLALAFAGMRFAAAGWTRAEAEMAQLEKAQAALRVLSRWISAAHPVVTREFDEPIYAFFGASNAVRFAYFAPPYPTIGGLHAVELSIEPQLGGESGELLVAYRRPFDFGGEFDAPFDDQYRVVMLATPARMRFEYFSAEFGWSANWDAPDAYPEAVRLILEGDPLLGDLTMTTPIATNSDFDCVAPEPEPAPLCREDRN